MIIIIVFQAGVPPVVVPSAQILTLKSYFSFSVLCSSGREEEEEYVQCVEKPSKMSSRSTDPDSDLKH